MIVERRPTAYKLSDSVVDATIINSGGDALVVSYYHGLSDGDVVYIKSEAESYNGFKFVDVIEQASFKIRDTENGTNITFKKETPIEFWKSVLTHGWISAHQPIVYQISNDKFPVNDAYLTSTVLSVTDNNGYMRIVCSGNIDADLVDMDYVKVGDTVYQIKDAESDSVCTLNIVYDASEASLLIGETVVFHYNNYHILVRVFAGLNSSHPYASQKPYILLATLKFIPDENNLVTFDISELLRGNIVGKNNLLLDSLPLNLDAFTQFFISYAEGYDQSDGSDISGFVSAFEADPFEGYAIDSVMPFKSRDINTLSDYVASDAVSGKWLTLFARPIYVPGLFFDLSFIKNLTGDFFITVNGNVLYFEDKGPGVYRITITEDILYSDDELCISASLPETIILPPAEPTVADFNDEQQLGSGVSWTLEITPTRYEVTVSPLQESKLLAFEIFGGVANADYSIGYDVTFDSSDSITISLYDDGLAQSVSENVVAGSGNHTGTVILTPGFIPKYLTWRTLGGLSSQTVFIEAFTFSVDTGDPVTIPATDLVREICIDVVDLCEPSPDGCPPCAQSGGSGQDAILLEGDGFILLE